jgi:hypothetical protein
MALFKRLNRTDPEQIFIVVLANEGAALTKDATCQWEVASASVDGVRVRDVDTANEWCFAGVVDAATADGAYGLIQIYGYRSSSVVFQTDTSQTTGLPLVPVAGQEYFQSVVSSTTSSANVTQRPIMAVLLESITDQATSSTVSRKIFIRAM